MTSQAPGTTPSGTCQHDTYPGTSASEFAPSFGRTSVAKSADVRIDPVLLDSLLRLAAGPRCPVCATFSDVHGTHIQHSQLRAARCLGTASTRMHTLVPPVRLHLLDSAPSWTRHSFGERRSTAAQLQQAPARHQHYCDAAPHCARKASSSSTSPKRASAGTASAATPLHAACGMLPCRCFAGLPSQVTASVAVMAFRGTIADSPGSVMSMYRPRLCSPGLLPVERGHSSSMIAG